MSIFFDPVKWKRAIIGIIAFVVGIILMNGWKDPKNKVFSVQSYKTVLVICFRLSIENGFGKVLIKP